jgi:hypothetical protein
MNMKADQLKWTTTCCAWHGDYAESKTMDGGAARIKRGPEVDGYLVMLFDGDGVPVNVDADSVPVYVEMTADALELILI